MKVSVFELEERYPRETRLAIANFGSDAGSVMSLIEELATDDCSMDDLEDQIAEEIFQQLEHSENVYHSGI